MVAEALSSTDFEVVGMHGGVKFYRGAAAAARHYVEADHARVDDYYLAEGTGLAERFVATPDDGVEHLGALDGDGYESWVAGLDPETLEPRGRLRKDGKAVRFVEVTVNGPKTWSLAAALHPEVAAAYDAAQDRAAQQIIGWLAEHTTTRLGPRGRQVQVPVERIEAVTVKHFTSRAGDPHRHLHLQINARVLVSTGPTGEQVWRGLHTRGVRDMIDAINGIGHAAVACDPEFRAALARHGFTMNTETGEVDQLAGFVGAFSARARQIGANISRYEAEWRKANPGREPGPELFRAWDRRAWAEARPDKVVPKDGTELSSRWVEELLRLGYRPAPLVAVGAVKPGELDRDAAIRVVVSRLGAKRSAWNAADIRGEVEQLIARVGIIADPAVRIELAEDLTARATDVCVPLLEETGTPEHIRALTSRDVMQVEADLVLSMSVRAGAPGSRRRVVSQHLDPAQRAAAGVLCGTHRLVVVEGAAGAGKTATLAATRRLIEGDGHRLMVVTPTLKAAQVAVEETDTQAFSAAWLAHQYGFRWDENGRWTRERSRLRSEARLRPGDLLLVDEAGMVDQDTARALFTIADETGARIALVGDRHQLPAVGRGGVLDLAARWADPDACVTLDVIHRFSDPSYAELSLAMRTGEDPGTVFDRLVTRGQVIIHSDDATRTAAVVEAATEGALVVADTREQVADLNAAIHDYRLGAAELDPRVGLVTVAGERLLVGDRVVTRRNDYDLGVANRDTWTVTAINDDGSLQLRGKTGTRTVPLAYAGHAVELAYTATVYGVQGETTKIAHLVLGEHTGAASAYVAMTRGRESNVVHIVAENTADARRQWVETFARDRADLGPGHAARLAAEEAAKYVPIAANPRPRYRPARRGAARRHPVMEPQPSRPSVPPRAPGIGF